ncbi:MAG: hypothetical protein JO125_11980 [Chloroflexi bacterium]|nr:hypothetical protein [Ktedonobacteraceae bacterium]MBV9019268.1 hypothetical protein [Ktedonobacteraceae bacterium]MBV9708114.1 hypothetical protein [Chloroflexota bacterium]
MPNKPEYHILHFSQSLVPVYMPGQRPKLLSPQDSWWEICSGWVRYHVTQLRWDIERGFARLLRRRWT